ncbi:MAG: glucose-1-phosphate thymidylyltransferase [Deltaproteobacteria bacterium]|nr:glucose-1-phosphate thymidylyltransferase [Deltaproteobacteria bacterium]MBI3389376.1 glucose-1-phosphate thymidylyltransferase [Deltaproteobacteria bacterium]
MKAVVLCAGFGTRMRPLTDHVAKHLIPVANKPVLFYALENIVAAGARDICIVVNPATHEQIEAQVHRGERFGARVQYVEQPEPLGLAHAVHCAREFASDEPFVLYLADTLIDEPIANATARFEREHARAVVMLAAVADPQRYGVAQVDGDRIILLVEKSAQPPSNLAFIGACVLDRHIFEVIENLQPSARGEYEITDAIQALVARGRLVLPHVTTRWWKDTGTPAALLDANRVLLDRISPDIRGSLDAASSVTGKAIIGAGTVIQRSRVVGPVLIGNDVRIDDATIGPYASIGDRSDIRRTIVEDSIVMDGSILDGAEKRVTGSIVTAGVRLRARQ